MPLDSAERLYLERQVTLARAILVALALLVLLETPGESYREASAWFLAAYLAVAIAVVLSGSVFSDKQIQIPLIGDVAALVIFLMFRPPVSSCWFLFLFVVFGLATRGKARAMLALGYRLCTLASDHSLLRAAAQAELAAARAGRA